MRPTIALISSVALVVAACGGDDPLEDELGIARFQVAELEDQLTELEDQQGVLASELESARERLAAAQDRAETAERELGRLQRQIDQGDDTRTLAVEERDEAREERDRATGQLDGAVAERDAARAERDAARAERDAARAERDDVQAELDAVRLRFDPEIRAAVANAQVAANDEACARGDAFGFDPNLPEPDAEAIIDSVVVGLPDFVEVDIDAVQARLDECIALGEARAVQATLTEPKGDGFWTVGLEIAPGLWRSTGTGDSCFWQRSPDGMPDEIIDDHFGNAGGSVTILEGEEFQTDGCGTWEFAG